MIEAAVIPILIKIAAHVIQALLVDTVHKRASIGFVAGFWPHASQTMLARRIDKNVERVITATKDALAAAAYQHAISNSRRFFHRQAAQFGHVFAVKRGIAAVRSRRFESASP